MLTLTPSGLSNGMVATIACGNDTEQVSSLFREFTADLSDESTVERTRKYEELASKGPVAAAQNLKTYMDLTLRSTRRGKALLVNSSGMVAASKTRTSPLWLTSIPPAYLKKGREQGP